MTNLRRILIGLNVGGIGGSFIAGTFAQPILYIPGLAGLIYWGWVLYREPITEWLLRGE